MNWWSDNPRNTRPKTVLENEYRVLVSEYRKPKNGRNGVPFPKNSVDPQTETRGLWVVWGAYVHPKKPWKIIGEPSLSFLGPGKNLSLEAKWVFFCPWVPCLGPQNMDQKIQKWVSDTSTGQKQHIFIPITSKNHVLVSSDTSQLQLKSGPNQVLLGKMLLFQPIFGPLGNEPKIKKLHF